MWRPVSVCAIEDGDEVSLECLNCSFCWVSLMHVGVDQLAVKVLCFDACNEAVGHFVVQAVEDWLHSSVSESLAACIMPLDQVVCPSAFDWFSKCGIGVMIAEDEDAAEALDALPGEHAWWVSADEASQFFQFESIGCHLVLPVDSGLWWVKWFFLSEERSQWCSGGLQSLSDLSDSSHQGWN